MRVIVAVVVVVSVAPSWALAQSSSAVVAPTGVLRAAFLGGNPVHGRIDAATGAATGTVPDLIRELARRVNVPSAVLTQPSAAAVVAALKEGTADIGFLAFDEERARDVDFGAAFVVMLNSYLVNVDSPIMASADVDRAGVVVAAVRGTSQQLFVSRRLTNARVRLLDTMPPHAEVERLLGSGEVDAFAINRQRSLDAQAAAPSRLRVLGDSFMKVNQSVVVPKGARMRLDAVNALLVELVSSGFVKASAERAGVSGVEMPLIERPVR